MANILPIRFTKLREQRGLTQVEMGNLLGVTGKYVGMIERGEKPVDEESSLGLLFQVAESSNAPTQVLMDRDEVTHDRSTRMIPVVGWAHAGDARSYEEVPDSWKERIPTECRDPKAFGVRLEGDSMEQKFSEGDILVVQPSEEAHSGCLVVARFANDGVIFRRYEMTGSTITLVPLNHRYQATQHTADEFSWIYPVWGRITLLWRK